MAVGEKAALYDRISDIGQEDNNSVQTQHQKMNDHCIANGYIVEPRHIFHDTHTGIESWRERKDIQELLACARRREFTILVLYHTDRLARGDDLIVLVSELYHYGVRVESATQDLKNDTAGKILLHVLAISSQLEWERTRERTQDNKRTRVRNNNLLGAKPSYGYAWENPQRATKDFRDCRNRYIINPKLIFDNTGVSWTEQQLLTAMYHMVDDGKTLYEVKQWLFMHGIPTYEGKPLWDTSTISKMLKRPEHVTGKKQVFATTYKKIDGHKYYQPTPLEQQITVDVPPLLLDAEGNPDVALFERVRVRLEQNKTFAPRGNPDPEDALLRAGYAKCAYCKNTLYVHHRNPDGKPEYVCHKGMNLKTCKTLSIPASIIDEAAWKRAVEVISDPVEFQKVIAEIRGGTPEVPEISSAATRLKEIEEEINSLIDAKRTSKSETAQARIRYWLDVLEKEEVTLKKQQQENDLIRGKWELADEEVKKFETWCEDFRKNLATADYQKKRDAFAMLGLKVWVSKYERPKRQYQITITPPKIWDIVRQLSG